MKVYRKYLDDEKVRWAAMKWQQGYSQLEIAKVLGVTPVTLCNALKPYRKKKPNLPPLVYDPDWEKNEGGEVK